MRIKNNRGQRLTSARLMVLGLASVISVSFFPSSHAQNNSKVGPCRPQGAVQGCSAKGKPGQQVCDGGVWSVCTVNPNRPPPPAPVTGTLKPKFYVLTVIYAPPGTNGGSSTSTVTYGEGSTTGSTVSASSAFKQSVKVSATAEGDVPGFTVKAEASFGEAQTTTAGESTEITFAKNQEISDTGPPADDVDHDQDLIYLLLRPTIQMTVYQSAPGQVSQVDWKLIGGKVVYYYVGWLNNHLPMPNAELHDLQNSGVSPQDYPTILKADPFASLRQVRIPPSQLSSIAVLGTQTPDPRRFEYTNESFPYEPPAVAKEQPPTKKITLTHTVNQTSSNSSQTEYSVGLNVESNGSFLDLAKVTLKDETAWTWTDTFTNSSSNIATESAAIVVGGPAFGYQGTVDNIDVYFDKIFKTFLFWPVSSSSASLTGTIMARNGEPAGGQEVYVFANGVRHRTFTNSMGQYRVFGRISGPVRVQAGGVTREMTLPGSRKVDVVLSR